MTCETGWQSKSMLWICIYAHTHIDIIACLSEWRTSQLPTSMPVVCGTLIFDTMNHIQTLIPLCPAGVCPCFEETPCRTAELPLQVLDYIPPGKFHQLARMCSIQGDTVHYGYSMNWVAPWLEQNEGILWEGTMLDLETFLGIAIAAHMIWLTALVWQHLGRDCLFYFHINILYGFLIHVGMWFTVQHPHRYRAVSF